LNAGGSAVTSSVTSLSIGSASTNALSVSLGVGGRLIFCSYTNTNLVIGIPNDSANTGGKLLGYDITPQRSPKYGEQKFIIGGANFGTNVGNVVVKIGGAGGVLATVTSVTNSRITGIFPPNDSNGVGVILDIYVKVGSNSVIIPKAFKYIN
jgi:hypothetical protein